MMLFSCLLFLIFLSSLGYVKTVRETGYRQAVCQTEGCKKEAETILFSMDPSINPCDDFYQYACGGYINKTKIPSDLTYYDPLTDLNFKLLNILRDVMDNVENTEYKPFELVSNSYKACMDQDSIEKKGGKPLTDVLNELLGGWPILVGKNWNKANFDTITKIAELRRYNGKYIILMEARASYFNNSENIMGIDQPALGLVRDFLVKDEYTTQRNAYTTYMNNIAELLQGKKLSRNQIKEINEILQFERELAKITERPEDRKDVSKTYEIITLKKAQKKVGKEINLKNYFNTILKGVSKINCTDNIILGGGNGQFYHSLTALLKKTSKRTIANYLGWRLSMDLIPYLSSNFRQATKKFDNVIQGKSDERERWIVCVENVNNNLPTATGKLYVDAKFDEESKKYVLDFVYKMKDGLHDILEENDWMDASTKEKALIKLNATRIKVGYPDSFNDPSELEKEYEGLTSSPNNHFQNNVNYLKYITLKSLKELPLPVDKNKWPSGVAVINAFNDFTSNSLILLAAFLQLPVFDVGRPRSVNYGAIGMVAGHEFSHSFDDTGKSFDENGNIINWWSKSSSEKFVEKSKCIVDQYDNYFMPEINLTVNGRNTLGENIADNAGLKVAYQVFKKVQKELGHEPSLPGLPNLNDDQLFFLGYANIWCQVSSIEALRFRVVSDVHSPPKYRVNGPALNLPGFYEAFDCPPSTTQIIPRNMCNVW